MHEPKSDTRAVIGASGIGLAEASIGLVEVSIGWAQGN